MTTEIRSEKRDLVERLGVFMEQKEHHAPVAARILSHIVLTGKVGTTFEDLVTDLGASKSTISTHLNHLADLKKIVYFTKPGDRKKYYTINEDSIVQSIDTLLESWMEQKALHHEIKKYKRKVNEQTDASNTKFALDFHENYIQFLDEVTQSVSTLRSRIIEKTTKL